ncbi:MAG: hypothetical protein HOC91_00310 [Nitrospinaceae bacterium]|nr:hypothetical protein [Nitrospinaceae bacterium]MBT3434353.1 hypothetical protein [Nitrospinaceae bacterium]MBT4428937.1 hypothetical protein [Nitrospinaceae bacterium]MBT5368664.1 hypothetical protein [Nitrospinaceae bacterium]MBT5947601.1 hypothetical protein [Nitrospinaceae bacterium]
MDFISSPEPVRITKRWRSIHNNPPAPGRFYLVVFFDRFEPQYRFTGLTLWTGEGWTEPISDLDLEKNLFFEVTHWVEIDVAALGVQAASDTSGLKLSNDYLVFFMRGEREYPSVAVWDGLWLDHTGGSLACDVTRWHPIDIPYLP